MKQRRNNWLENLEKTSVSRRTELSKGSNDA